MNTRTSSLSTPMASIITNSFFLFILLLPSLMPTHASNPKKPLKEKMSHIHFFFHETVGGPNATTVQVAGPPTFTGSGFGIVMVLDDPLTEGPEPTSKLIGRAQGMYAFADQQEVGLMMVMNLAFVEGKYNGSVLSVLGRNPAFHPVREMPVVGGAGLFRFARGYAVAKTYSLGTSTAVVEYNVYVLH